MQYDDWEMACCGEPFRVGDTVEWNVYPARGEAGLWLVTHHGDCAGARAEDGGPGVLTGTVTRIRLVVEGFLAEHPGSRTFSRVPGERWLWPLTESLKWFGTPEDIPSWRDGRRYERRQSGLLVDVDTDAGVRHRLAMEGLAEIVEDYEARHGPLTEREIRAASRELFGDEGGAARAPGWPTSGW